MKYQKYSVPCYGPKWSLTGETARAVFSLKTGAPICAHKPELLNAVKMSSEFKSAGTFDSFLAVNSVELVD